MPSSRRSIFPRTGIPGAPRPADRTAPAQSTRQTRTGEKRPAEDEPEDVQQSIEDEPAADPMDVEPGFFPDTQQSSSPPPGTTLSAINTRELEHRLEQLNTTQEDDEEVPVEELGFAALRDLQDMHDYQEPPPPEDNDDEASLSEDEQAESTTASTAATVTPATTTTATPAATEGDVFRPPSLPTAAIQGFGPDQSQIVPYKRAKEPMTELELALGLWCQASGVSRADFGYLRNILDMVAKDPGLVEKLPRTIDSVKAHTRQALPLLQMRKKAVPVNTLKQAIGPSVQTGVEDLYFFDMIDFCKAYFQDDLVVGKKSKMFYGMGHIVDEATELWESNAWHSTIRITSGEFAKYAHGRQRPAEHSANDNFLGYRGGPVFPSDFVEYRCNDAGCGCSPALQDDDDEPEPIGLQQGLHYGRIIAVGKDCRISAGHTPQAPGQAILKVQRLLPGDIVAGNLGQGVTLEPRAESQELFVVENHIDFVGVDKVMPARRVVQMHYTFESVHKPQDLPTSYQHRLFVRRIVTMGNQGIRRIRTAWKAHPIRGELEILHFGRQWLEDHFVDDEGEGQEDGTPLNKFGKSVKSFPFVFFIDGFGLYRNMYRTLLGFYLLNGALSNQERNIRKNVIPLTLGPHGSNPHDVIDAIGPSMSALDKGMDLDDCTFVCAFTFFFIGDMPQQQANSGFLTQRAKYGCRGCIYPSSDWGSLDLDITDGGRYHHEVMRIRRQMEKMRSSSTPAAVKKFADSTGKSMSTDTVPLERIAPALDIILTRPPDPAHSELQGLTKLILDLLLTDILTEPAKKQFADALRSFSYPPEWTGRLQNPITHLGSYNLSQFGRASVIFAMLLRCWLKDSHLRPYFKKALPEVMADDVEFFKSRSGLQVLPPSLLVMAAFSRMAGSNRNLLAGHLDAEQRKQIGFEGFLGRRMFQALYETAARAAENDPKASKASTPVPRGRSKSGTPGGSRSESSSTRGRQAKRARGSRGRGSRGRGSRGRGGSAPEYSGTESDIEMADPNDDDGDDDEEDDDEEDGAQADRTEEGATGEQPKTKRGVKYRKTQARPNVHQGQHLLQMANEYGLVSNCNVFIGEDQNREFKQLIYNTNKRNPERDLLHQMNLQITTRFVINNVFDEDEPDLTKQVQEISKSCPGLLDRLMPRSARGNVVEEDEDVLEELDGIRGVAGRSEVKARKKLSIKHVKDVMAMPVRGNDKNMPVWFQEELTAAFKNDYGRANVTYPFASKPIKYFKTLSYTETNTGKRVTLHRGDFLLYHNADSPGRIDQIFTFETVAGYIWAFLRISKTVTKEPDPITMLKILELTGEDVIVGLSALVGARRWVLPVFINDDWTMRIGPAADKCEAGQQFLDVDWDLTFL